MQYVFWITMFFWWAMDFYVLTIKRNEYSKILDRKSKLIVTVLIFGGVILAIAPEHFRAVWRTRAFGLFQIAGTIVVIAGVMLRLTAILTLGRYFSPDIAITPDRKLVRKGLYRKIRHPSYTGEIISFIGLAILFQHFPSSLFISLLPTLAFVYRAIIEEQKLLEEFGEEFMEHKKNTRMFI